MLEVIKNMIVLDWRRRWFRKREDKGGKNDKDEVDCIEVYGWEDLYGI